MDKVFLFTTTWCPHCKAAKEKLKDKIEKGEIEVIEVDKDEFGEKVADALGIYAVPTFVVAKDDGTACVIDHDTDGNVRAMCKVPKDEKGCVYNLLNKTVKCKR